MADFMVLEGINDEEDMAADDELYATQASAALLILGAEAGRVLRNERRNQTRTYLCRPQLPPNPRAGTAWITLFTSRNDRAYITTMGFDVETFELIVTSGFGARWYSQPIRRADAAPSGNPRPGARSLDAWGALGLVLHYLNSTMSEISLQQIFGLIPTTVSRYIRFGLTNLRDTLREMKDAAIRWPRTDGEFKDLNNLVIVRHPLLVGAFGGIDGLNLPTETSDNPDIENATYNGWLSEHFISSVLAFSSEGTLWYMLIFIQLLTRQKISGVIIDVNTNAPGSWHDSRVAQPMYEKLLTKTPDGFYLVADTAFPRGSLDIAGRIEAPIKHGETFRGTVRAIDDRFDFDQQLLSYRQTAEWGMRSIQGSFGRLRLPLPINDEDFRIELLESVFRLHNLRTRRIGYNQIRTVYMPEWRKTAEADDIWLHFESMLFSDQIKNDRVSRYHVFPEYQ